MALLEHTPTTTPADAERILREVYGLEVEATSLASERDKAFRVEASDGRRWVLKVSNALEDREVLEAQTEAAALAGAAGVPVQHVHPAADGDLIPRRGRGSPGRSAS